MALEIRPITDDEVEQAEYIRAYAFNVPERGNLTEQVERIRRFFPLDWSLASFEDGEMTAFMRTIPMAMRINGRGLGFGAVGPVVSLPQHRRKGHVGALLRRSLEVMRERGQVLSGLHTPHPMLYRRYGWEIASSRRVYTFAPKDITLQAQPEERGRMRLMTVDDWGQLDRVYRQYCGALNGPLHRGEIWWREAIFQPGGLTPADVALWEDGQGEPQGYVVFHQARTRAFDDDTPPFWVRELVALTPDAYLNLILFILRHDLPAEISWTAPGDDPFRSLVDDARKVKVEDGYDMMLRICDVPAALRLRPPAYAEHPVALTMEITDTSAPWNEGVWHVEVADGAVHVDESGGEADVSLSATALAPLFNGYLSPGGAALAGLLRMKNEEALSAAEALFATLYPPFCFDRF